LGCVPEGLHIKYDTVHPTNNLPDGVGAITLKNIFFYEQNEPLCFKKWKRSKSLRALSICDVSDECTMTSNVSR
jgi:hypothetical protein